MKALFIISFASGTIGFTACANIEQAHCKQLTEKNEIKNPYIDNPYLDKRMLTGGLLRTELWL
jgi:hypothetical protein